MNAKQYIPYSVNFRPVAESETGLLEISENQQNRDATKFWINQSNGSVTFQISSTVRRSLLFQVHLGEGSLNRGNWNTVLNVPAATPEQPAVVSETVSVPVPPPGINMYIRILGAVSYVARSEDFVAVGVYPLPGVENVA